MAIEYSILLAKKSVDEDFLTRTIRKVYKGKLEAIPLEKGFIVSNAMNEIGFNYSLIEIDPRHWGWDDDLLKTEFKYLEHIGFRCSKFLDFEKINQNLYTVIFHILSSIDCDMIVLQTDLLLFVKKEGKIFVQKESIEWLNKNLHDLIAEFQLNLIPLEAPI